MENTSDLRRRAALCLRLSDFCSDPLLADYLRFKAADYHQKAVQAELDDFLSDEPGEQLGHRYYDAPCRARSASSLH